jgi:hypothetical protein
MRARVGGGEYDCPFPGIPRSCIVIERAAGWRVTSPGLTSINPTPARPWQPTGSCTRLPKPALPASREPITPRALARRQAQARPGSIGVRAVSRSHTLGHASGDPSAVRHVASGHCLPSQLVVERAGHSVAPATDLLLRAALRLLPRASRQLAVADLRATSSADLSHVYASLS